jgi:hypothetical protein
MFLPILAVSFLALGCEDDTVEPEGPFDLTFRGDATFQGPHADQAIAVALVASDGEVIETMTGTVSGTADPTFSFTFANLLEDGESYEVHYWIDANFGGGTAGTCDAPPTDHMWNVAIGPVNANVTNTQDHDATDLEDVCASFAG